MSGEKKAKEPKKGDYGRELGKEKAKENESAKNLQKFIKR